MIIVFFSRVGDSFLLPLASEISYYSEQRAHHPGYQKGQEQRMHMLQNGWEVYQFLGQGLLRPVSPSRPSEPGHNLMCIKPGCGLVSFLPGTDDTGAWADLSIYPYFLLIFTFLL